MIDGVVQTVGWALIDAAWQGILVGALYASARLAVSDARLRLAIGHLALLALALLPLASLLWRLYAPQPLPEAALGAMLAGGAAAVDGAPSAAAWSIDVWLPWLVGAWAVGVAVHSLRLFGQWRGLRRLCAQSSVVDPDWLDTLARLRNRLGVKARVRLLHGVQVTTPMLVGVLRPTILLPSSLLLQLPRAQVELILIHELAHLRRLDTWFNLLQTCLDTLLFFHPAVHWISRKVREDRELCCDQLVLARGGDPMLYARTLLAMAEAHHHAHAPAPALGAAGGLLLERVQRIVDVPPARQGTQMPALGTVLALAALLWLLKPAGDENVLHDLGLPPLAASGIVAAVPSLAGLQFSVADMAAAVEPLVLRAPPRGVDAGSAQPLPAAVAPDAAPAPIATPPLAPMPALLQPELAPAALSDSTVPVAPVQPVAARDAAVDAPPPAAAAPREPRALQQVAPEYPSNARLAAVEGFVVLRYRVDGTGRARDVRLIDAEPSGVFEKAARRALAQWRFEPEFGAAGDYLQQFDFRLEGGDGPGDAEAERCSIRIGSRLCRPTP
ncbi:M56 family metallopeptidase [Chiayiivirga flava]|uniref:Protein TonB n=1 Tax=Chiayiivirga flava TaxID=659595 RepID=A0A7W8D8W2_9GAMM|nr:M56 family metallopeptidase [Chiayiivirga flava]MBB5208950.1 TonB family protein [Chiayiivirga flava]